MSTRRVPGAPVALWALLLPVLLLPAALHASHALGMATQMGIAVLACLSFHVLWGQAGMLSFGHAVYTGAGAYLCMHGLQAVAGQGWPMPVPLLPLLSGLGAALIACPLGWLSTRRAGTPFAMITLGLGELVAAAALMFSGVFGGEAGLSGDRTSGAGGAGFNLADARHLYALTALHVWLALLLVWLSQRTTLGRLLGAVRDNPMRVPFIGYDPATLRLMAFVWAAFLAGVSGALAALLFEIVTPDLFSLHRSGNLLVFTLLGGATLLGPVLGGVLMVAAMVGLSALTPAWLLYTGLVFMVGVIWAPQGLAGLLLLPPPGGWRHRLVSCLRGQPALLAFWGVLGCGGAVVLIEMGYHRALANVLGPTVSVAGLTLDTGAAAPWLWAGGAVVAALWGAHRAWRRIKVSRS